LGPMICFGSIFCQKLRKIFRFFFKIIETSITFRLVPPIRRMNISNVDISMQLNVFALNLWPGTDVVIFKNILPKNSAKKLAVFTQN
jgi:hypothetical protein